MQGRRRILYQRPIPGRNRLAPKRRPQHIRPGATLILLDRASAFRPFEAPALFDARPGWDLLKTALNSDPQPSDGREPASAFVRVPLGGDDGDRYREVV